MWQCPVCQRTLKRENQRHVCGPVDLVDQYISEQDAKIRPLLETIRQVIREEAPEALETIAWQMPTYRQHENLIHFAAATNHVGLYPGEEVIRVFADRLSRFKTSKGTIRLPLDEPLDVQLLRDIVRWRVHKVNEKLE